MRQRMVLSLLRLQLVRPDGRLPRRPMPATTQIRPRSRRTRLSPDTVDPTKRMVAILWKNRKNQQTRNMILARSNFVWRASPRLASWIDAIAVGHHLDSPQVL